MTQTTYKEFLATLDKEKREKLTTEIEPLERKLMDQAVKEDKTSAALGETAFAIQQALAKAGAGGQFSAFLREQKLARSTIYDCIRVFRWTKVPAEFKAIAEKYGKSLNLEVIQNSVIKVALAAEPGTVAEADKKLTELAAAAEPGTTNPINAAIDKASDILLAAYNGKIDMVVALAGGDEIAEAAARLDTTLESLTKAARAAAANAIQKLRQTVAENKTLKLKGVSATFETRHAATSQLQE